MCILSVRLIGLRVCAISDLSKLANHVKVSGVIMLFLVIGCGHGFELCRTVASSNKSELMLEMRLDLTYVLVWKLSNDEVPNRAVSGAKLFSADFRSFCNIRFRLVCNND